MLEHAELEGVHPEIRARAEWAISWAEYYGVPVTVTSGFRSLEDQARLRAKWEAGLSRWPANRPGESAHNVGLAWDSTVPSWASSWWVRVRELAGFRIPAGDEIHAEWPGWRQV